MNLHTKNFFNITLKENLFFLVNKCIKIALEERYKEIKKKKDGSIITKADNEIHSCIFNELLALYPDIPIISEEGKFEEKSFTNKAYWLIDPIDGSSSYARGKSDYTINIAFIKDGIPLMGIIAHPPSNTIWYGKNKYAIVSINGNEKMISIKQFSKNNLNIVMSKNYDQLTKELVDKMTKVNIKYYSSSLKFCKIAEGKADIYPRLQSINKWDIAAGDAILRAAGGIVFNENGKEILYNTTGSETGKFFALSSEKLWENVKNKI